MNRTPATGIRKPKSEIQKGYTFFQETTDAMQRFVGSSNIAASPIATKGSHMYV